MFFVSDVSKVNSPGVSIQFLSSVNGLAPSFLTSTSIHFRDPMRTDPKSLLAATINGVAACPRRGRNTLKQSVSSSIESRHRFVSGPIKQTVIFKESPGATASPIDIDDDLTLKLLGDGTSN